MLIEIDRQTNPIEPQQAPSIQEALVEFNDVQTEVNSLLRWDELKSDDERMPANCVGFTVLASEILQDRDMRHKIGFVNGHAMIIALLDDGNKHEQWMFDPLSPQLDQNVDSALSPMSVRSDERDFAFVFPERIRTNHLDHGIHPADMHPWMALEKPTFISPDSSYSSGLSKRLIMTLFKPELGRDVLKDYQEYRRATEHEDLSNAARAVIEMSGLFPDIDIRTHHPSTIQRLVKDLSHEGYVDTAEDVTEAFYSSFNPSNDTRIEEYKADCLQAISRISGRSEFAKRAVEIYKELMRRPRASKNSIAGKLAVSQSMLQ